MRRVGDRRQPGKMVEIFSDWALLMGLGDEASAGLEKHLHPFCFVFMIAKKGGASHIPDGDHFVYFVSIGAWGHCRQKSKE